MNSYHILTEAFWSKINLCSTDCKVSGKYTKKMLTYFTVTSWSLNNYCYIKQRNKTSKSDTLVAFISASVFQIHLRNSKDQSAESWLNCPLWVLTDLKGNHSVTFNLITPLFLYSHLFSSRCDICCQRLL